MQLVSHPGVESIRNLFHFPTHFDRQMRQSCPTYTIELYVADLKTFMPIFSNAAWRGSRPAALSNTLAWLIPRHVLSFIVAASS